MSSSRRLEDGETVRQSDGGIYETSIVLRILLPTIINKLFIILFVSHEDSFVLKVASLMFKSL